MNNIENNKNVMISPSFLSADFTQIKRVILGFENAGADMIHCDVMDGNFVPNISFGVKMVEDVKRISKLPLDVHLMIERPERYVDSFIDAGAEFIMLHYEASNVLIETLKHIKERNIKCGVAISPNTKVGVLREIIRLCDMVLLMSVHPGFGGQSFIEMTFDRISELNHLRNELSPSTLIEVDGGINVNIAKKLIEKGANVLVVGSLLVNSSDMKNIVTQIKA